jgi:hypothetical protein
MNNPPNATDQCVSCSGTGLKSIQTESGKYEPCYCVYGLARAAYANEWFPGADGVESVEQMWRFYLARGDTITQLRAELEAVRKERDSRKKWADVAEGDIEEARALFVKAGALESYDGDYSPSCLLECAEQIIQERDDAESRFRAARSVANHNAEGAKKAESQRDEAVATLAEARGLLEEAVSRLPPRMPSYDGTSVTVCDIKDRITAFLTPPETSTASGV